MKSRINGRPNAVLPERAGRVRKALTFEERRQRFLKDRTLVEIDNIAAFRRVGRLGDAVREALANAYYEGGQAAKAIERAKRRKTK